MKYHISLNYRARNCSITEEEVEIILQVPCCQICNVHIATERASKFDHHQLDKYFRGVLCNKCNSQMHGVDDKQWLALAIEYRDRHAERYAEMCRDAQ